MTDKPDLTHEYIFNGTYDFQNEGSLPWYQIQVKRRWWEEVGEASDGTKGHARGQLSPRPSKLRLSALNATEHTVQSTGGSATNSARHCHLGGEASIESAWTEPAVCATTIMQGATSVLFTKAGHHSLPLSLRHSPLGLVLLGLLSHSHRLASALSILPLALTILEPDKICNSFKQLCKNPQQNIWLKTADEGMFYPQKLYIWPTKHWDHKFDEEMLPSVTMSFPYIIVILISSIFVFVFTLQSQLKERVMKKNIGRIANAVPFTLLSRVTMNDEIVVLNCQKCNQ